MFTSKRYTTIRVSNELPLLTQIYLWSLIDGLKIERDYLQVFVLRTQGNMQIVEHSQEVPPYKSKTAFSCDNPINAKIYVIDDITHTTMLFSDEY